MIRTRYKKVLLVSPEVCPDQLTADYENITRIHTVNRIFPALFEETPNLIIFDYNYIGKDIDKIIRRIRTNSFYNKIKICCYKTKSEPKTDGLLKAIGVDMFVYHEDFKPAQPSKSISHIFGELLDRSVIAMIPNASN